MERGLKKMYWQIIAYSLFSSLPHLFCASKCNSFKSNYDNQLRGLFFQRSQQTIGVLHWIHHSMYTFSIKVSGPFVQKTGRVKLDRTVYLTNSWGLSWMLDYLASQQTVSVNHRGIFFVEHSQKMKVNKCYSLYKAFYWRDSQVTK